MLAMLELQTQVFIGRRVAFELVGDHQSGQAMVANEFSHQTRGRLGDAPTLNQHIQDGTMLVDRTPKPPGTSVDFDHHLVKMPLVAKGH